ncbi:MAG: hypothetical protein EXR77_06885 [Myxococcales bacterium]|nr:hypothetical protein [Myxococcales bacterium]
MPNLNDLRQLLEENDATYASRFAGQSRPTRDLDTLDDMIATAQQVAGEARIAMAGSASQRQEVAKEAERQLELYRSERTLIVKAQAEGGGDLRDAMVLGARANGVFHRYARHFAGQSRSSRDGSVLADMVAELQKIIKSMRELHARQPNATSISDDIDVVDGRIQQFNDERKEIAKAQTECTQQEAASAMAGAANTVFAQYRTHFAEQARVSRRPELLARLIDGAGQIADRMKAFQIQGLCDEHNDRNIGIVQDRLAVYHTELAAIRAERQKAPLAQLVAELGAAANREFAIYTKQFSGQSRETRDLSQLSAILDRLDELERQMTRIDGANAPADNAGNLRIVRDTITLYCNEWDAISAVLNKGA